MTGLSRQARPEERSGGAGGYLLIPWGVSLLNTIQAMTLAAQLATVPLVVRQFQTFPCIAPISNLPAILVTIVSLYRQGKIDDAANAFYAKVPLMRFEFQEGIGMAIRKEVLRRRGALANAAIRPPGGTLDATTTEALDRVMTWTLASNTK